MYEVVEVEQGVPVTGRRQMSETEWLQVVTGERRVSDFEFPLTEANRGLGEEGVDAEQDPQGGWAEG